MKRVVTFLFSFLIFTSCILANEVTLYLPNASKLYYDNLSYDSFDSSKATFELKESKEALLEIGSEKIDVHIVDKDKALVKWKLIDENIQLRYYKNNQKPKEIFDEIILSNLPFNEITTITLEAYSNGRWHQVKKLGVAAIPKKESRVSLSVSYTPYSFGIFDFYNAHNIKDAKSVTYTKKGYSLESEVSYRFNKSFITYGGFGYKRYEKRESIIPNSLNISYLYPYLGFDINMSKIFSLGLFSGGALAINANNYSFSPLLGLRASFNIRVNNYISLLLQSKVTAIYNDAKESLYKSMTYLIDSISFAIVVKL